MEINTTVANIIAATETFVNDANDIKVQAMDNWAYKAGNNLRYRIDVKRSIYTNYQFQRVGIRLEINLFPICVKCKINSTQNCPPIRIEPATLGLWHLLRIRSHAFLTELTWQVLIE